jgi:ATP-dependent helicase/nuclease subunit B
MAITLITGPANAGKAELVMDSLRGHAARSEDPLLVVPTSADADYHRRELAGEGVLMGVTVERFEGLLREAVRRAGVAERLLSGLAHERALAAVAARPAPPANGGRAGATRDERLERASVGAGRGFARALGELIAELRVRRVTPARFAAALQTGALANGLPESGGEAGVAGSAREVAALFARYAELLERIGRVDAEQRAVIALDALRRSPSRWGQTPVLFYGFDDFTPLQLDAIETLGAVVGAPVTVSLTYEPGRTAFAGRARTFHALEPIAAEHRVAGARSDYYAAGARSALSHLERGLFETDAGRVHAGGTVRLLEGGDERAELELVAGEIGKLLSQGIPPGAIAVLARAPAASADLLEEVFTAAGIPFSLQRRRPFADSAIGRALIGLLRCVPDAVESAGEAADLLAWLRAPGLLERPELADWLEASTRRSGARGAEQARALWEQRCWPLEAIERMRAAAERGAGALPERAARELEWLFSAPRRAAASVLASDEVDEARALAAGQAALRELAELAREAPRLAPRSPAELSRALESVEFLTGQRPSGAAVAVVDPLALRARRVRALFICRMQEGVFPAHARPQPLLSSEQRRALAEATGIRLGAPEDALAAERYLLYAAVSRPQELLVLSWHASGDDGSEQMRSLFVEDVCDLFEDRLRQVARGRLGAVIEPPLSARAGSPAHADQAGSPAHAGQAGSPAHAGQAGSPAHAGQAGSPAHAGRDASARSPVCPPEAALAPLRDGELLAELRGHVWSASSLEVWISCPVRWFVERLLRAETLDPDAEPLARGRLAHDALRDTLEALRAETGSARLEPARLERARELLRSALARRAAEVPLSPAPERRPGLRRRLQADLERYLEHAAAATRPADAERANGGLAPLEPTYLELGFGFGEDDQRGEPGGLPALDLGDGVTLRGRIDRVDVSGRGEAVVYDYKGRSVSPGAKWSALGELQVALYMRAVEALLGLRAVGGFYQPLTGADLRPRGVLDAEAGVQAECVRADRRTGSELRAQVAEAVELARRAAAEAARGELRASPRTCAFKGGCRYPTICRCERR